MYLLARFNTDQFAAHLYHMPPTPLFFYLIVKKIP